MSLNSRFYIEGTMSSVYDRLTDLLKIVNQS